MARNKVQTVTIEINGHRLVISIINDRRFFDCSTIDLARFDGVADPTEAIDEFERRATETKGE